MTDESVSAAPTSVPAPSTEPGFSLRFSARDLLSVAIFAVIYFVIVFAVAMVGIISPLVMLLTLPLAPIVAGIPYMLFLTRVKHAGMVTLFGVVVALLLFMMGHPWQSTVVTIVLSVIAEFVLAAGRYQSKWAAIWAYSVFSVWFIGPWIPFFIDPVAYVNQNSSMGEQYMQEFAAVVTVPAILVMVAVSVICGFLGALLGTALLRKHFRRAGLA
ncbi:MptD family putative ECF transporter S component [Microbacterium sediminicola]|uniref:MptD family putative ECF transporter S component n=1 Tax=Microbacterium sediminicola TaxID=415210 RepID=A0ABN2HYL7_9MICO